MSGRYGGRRPARRSENEPPPARHPSRSRSPPRRDDPNSREPPRRAQSPPPPCMSVKNLHAYGKAYCRYGNAIVAPSAVINEYVLDLALEDDEDADARTDDQEYILAQWPALARLCRGRLTAELKSCSADRLAALKSGLDKGWSLGRSDSVESVTKEVCKWIDFETVGDQSIIPADTTKPSAVTQKECLGFSNPTTAMLLCPVDMDINAAGVREGLLSGKHSKAALPALLFKDYKFDADKPEEFCGALHPSGLIKKARSSYQQVYTGPSSVGTDGRVAKGSNSDLAGQKGVNGPSLAFTGIVLRHAVSAAERCNLYDKEYDYESFYKQIMAFLDAKKDTDDSKKFFEQWNKCIFGTGEAPRNDVSLSALVAKAEAAKKKAALEAAAAEKAAREAAAAEKAAADAAAAERAANGQPLRDATNDEE